jgi:hypothetical protein
MHFAFDPQAVADAHEMELEHYALPNFDGLSDVAVTYPENELRLIADHQLRRVYLDALMDLHHLVEEYRFESLLALTLLRDYVIKRDRGEAPRLKLSGDERMDNVPWPAEAVVVMRRYAREPVNAVELFEKPHQQITGARILSRWFAGQLVDSALYRGIAACDRLAILLRCQAGVPIEVTKSGDHRQPAFTPGDLKELQLTYASVPEWQSLRQLTVNPLFEFIKQERNGFTHERRSPSELHGERAVVYSEDNGPEQVVPAMEAETHYTLAPAFYNEILRPAIELTRTVVVASAASGSAAVHES